MNFKNIFKKSSAIVVSSALTLGAFTANTFAAEAQPAPETISGEVGTLTKNLVLTESDAYQPAVDYTFTISNGTVDSPQGTPQVSNLRDGSSLVGFGNVGTKSDTISYDGSTKGSDSSKTLDLVYDVPAGTQPGVYRVKITESASKDIDGLENDTEKYLDLYIQNGANGPEVTNTIIINDDGSKSNGEIENAEGNSVVFTNTFTTKSLTVAKEVQGNGGDQEAKFTFNITINGEDGENYNYVVNGGEAKKASSGQQFTIELAHGESVIINGLTPEDTITVDEADYSADGYETKGEVTDDSMGSEDKTVTVTNTRDQITPTGLIENIAPFILAIAAAGIVFFIYFKKDKNEEEQLA